MFKNPLFSLKNISTQQKTFKNFKMFCGEREKSAGEAEKREEDEWRYRWKKEDIELYKEKTKKIKRQVSIEEKWRALKELVHDAMTKIKKRN